MNKGRSHKQQTLVHAVYLSDDKGHIHRADRVNELFQPYQCITKTPRLARTCYTDCVTNFVGAYNELQASLNDMDNNNIQLYLASKGCDWLFNAPHSSHVGGVWERMIGVAR